MKEDLMAKLWFLVVAVVVVSALAVVARPEAVAPVEKSPHAAALELVFQKAAERIRAVDTANWWHDTEERGWIVRRPFAPGTIDSTHLFNVTYQIAGKPVASWLVDTRKGTVDEATAGK
jgi:hypothetical protein